MSVSAPETVRFCQRCGSGMTTGLFQGKPRRKCPQCRYIHFVEPKIAVGAVLLDAGRILLVQRVFNPEKGRWCLPAGYLDAGETPEQAVAREVHEETGLHVDVGSLEAVYADTSGVGAAVTLVYNTMPTGGTLKAADDAADAAFFELSEVPDLAFDSTRDIVERLRAHLPEDMQVLAKAGLDPEQMLEVINASSGRNTATEWLIPNHVLNGLYDFGGANYIIEKDLELWRREAEGYEAPMWLGTTLRTLYLASMAKEGRQGDLTQLAKTLEEWAGVEIPKTRR